MGVFEMTSSVKLDQINEVGGVPHSHWMQDVALQLVLGYGSASCAPPTIPAAHHPGVLDLVQQLSPKGDQGVAQVWATAAVHGTAAVLYFPLAAE